jgi:hypothetical protein
MLPNHLSHFDHQHRIGNPNFTGENSIAINAAALYKLSSPRRRPTMRLEFWDAAKH